MIRDQPIFTGGSEEVWCWDQLEGWEVNLRRCVCFESSFACRVWQRERLAAWMITLDGLLGTNDHGLGRQDAHPPPPAHPRHRWPPTGVANTFSNPLMPNVPSFFAPWTYFEILITVSAQQHTPVARPKSLLTGKDVKAERMANWGPSGGKQWGAPLPARPVAHEVPAWGGRSLL